MSRASALSIVPAFSAGVSDAAPSLRIADLAAYAGVPIRGIFRLSAYQARTDRYGRPYWQARLEDMSGSLCAYGWSQVFTPDPCVGIGQPVEAELRIRFLNGGPIGDLVALRPASSGSLNPLRLLPRSRLPRPDYAARLEQFIDACPVPVLQQFLFGVFREEPLARAFLTLPASQAHHHAWAGGLAEHSLEVAALVERTLVRETLSDRTLAVVAGLLHDIGKARVLHADGQRTSLGFVLRHEVLTLELLADGLRFLESRWPDGAVALRYLLTWQNGARDSRPLLPSVLALQFADRYSSATATRDQAFHRKPDWQRFARLEVVGPPTRFWRPHHFPGRCETKLSGCDIAGLDSCRVRRTETE